MAGSIPLGVAALLTLLPAALLPSRFGARGHSGLFWLLIGVATVGPLALEIAARGGVWRTGFSATLWTIVGATMLVYALICLVSQPARGLRVFLLPYLVALAVIALLWSSVPGAPLPASAMTAWLQVHIGVSVATYALITISAAAAAAVWLKERALRRHAVPDWIDAVPSVAEGERLQHRLLLAAEVVLGVGLLTGVATGVVVGADGVALDHKTILSVAAFAVIGILLLLQRGSGLRGRHAARFVLIAYLLITLAFPGVKFVTDVLLT
ncbi:MAG: cytochrome c biogenesis protein CcsA [Alphaproteobacteria bacterium]|nr:cytochrome c biogenesis protein CcsA [Alphaproteobacteria bacterium]